MFGNRPNAKKPTDGLINRFQESFSDVVRSTKCEPPNRPANNEDFLNLNNVAQPTPGFRFTPFLDDFALATPRTQAYKDYISSGADNVFHGPAGDLHTPNMESKIITPNTLLEKFAVTPLHRSNIDTSYGHLDPQYFTQYPQGTSLGTQSAAYPPSAFVHTNFIDDLVSDPSEQLLPIYGDDADDADDGGDGNDQGHLTSQFVPVGDSFPPKVEKSPSHGYANFRYRVTLKTPTAMIHDPNDTPVTYLNKGHTYSLSIADSHPPPSANGLVKYRTSIRISFQDPEHTSSPAACWGLWKDTRSREVLQKTGTLNAVELVDLQGNEGRTHPVQLEKTSLDGFCITWLGDSSTGIPSCTFGIRFNFLSTDFSHSKGVKGAPLRLCAKTETDMLDTAEMSFCIVKLFRDHGAERKMFNDVSQLKRAIERRKQDFVKVQDGGDSLGKRKRGKYSAYASDQLDNRVQAQLQNNLDMELAAMQNIFNSNRPVSHFCLPGERRDDPDLFPVHLMDETVQKTNPIQPSVQTVTPPSTVGDGSGSPVTSSGNAGSEGSHEKTSPTDMSRATRAVSAEDTGRMEEGLKLKVPGQQVNTRPARCFYLRFQQSGVQQDDYHTAVYLAEPTIQELVEKIAKKQNFSQDHKVVLFRVSPNGMKILLDDDVVQRIPDGQDMSAEVYEYAASEETAPSDSSVPGIIEVRLHF